MVLVSAWLCYLMHVIYLLPIKQVVSHHMLACVHAINVLGNVLYFLEQPISTALALTLKTGNYEHDNCVYAEQWHNVDTMAARWELEHQNGTRQSELH